jgi:ACT domain-containing protein
VEQTEFEKELEIFRTEEETAQQYFFSYLSIRDLAGKNDDVLNVINTTPLFWVTVHHAMLLSAFVALGRIFDQNSRHNIDRLISEVAWRDDIP